MKCPTAIRALAIVATIASSHLLSPAHAEDPIRIGFITIRTGPLAGPGRQLENGFELFLKERNHMIAGRQVEVSYVDSAGSPATAKTKAQELVERYHANVIIGPLASNEALTVQDYIRDAKVPLISPSALEEDMTQRKANEWMVRATGTSSQISHVLGDYAFKTLKYKRIATIATDFAFGHETVAGFQRVFEDDGGQIVEKIWVPTNAVDMGTYIAQLGNVDAVYASFSGASAQNFIRQYAEYGKKGKIPLLASHATVEESLLQGMGDDAAGVISVALYTPSADNADNKKFAADFTKAYGVDPGFYSAGSYMAGLFFEAAIKKVGGNVEDKAALAKALHEVKFDQSIRGPISLDEYGNPISEIYVRETQRVNGRMENTIIKTYPMVSQFWTYDPEQFLKDPVYSRDFPPSKHLEN
jgi:branched-chain amino acid transport system substrate-binding protein